MALPRQAAHPRKSATRAGSQSRSPTKSLPQRETCAPETQVRTDSLLEEAKFEPSVPLWLGAFTWSKTSMSGPVGVGGFEEGEFEGDGPRWKKSRHRSSCARADAVELRAQEIDEAAKPRPGPDIDVFDRVKAPSQSGTQGSNLALLQRVACVLQFRGACLPFEAEIWLANAIAIQRG